jgi:ketosteroid isomerase-like protein
MTDATQVAGETYGWQNADAYDHDWQKAMGEGDRAALRRLLRPDAIVVHHDGRFETGSAYLDRNEQGTGPRIVAFAMTEGQAIRFESTVVITGKMEATVVRGDERRPLVGSVTRTWVRESGGWSLAALATSGH